ncbi:hypothetical protein KSS87_017564 [Heliosperma pusillum]|nr:hypothetical protein KSS87_017564 [Heliosperma pusillum]
MGEGKGEKKQHAACIAWPAQGHITPMLQLAKILNSKGFYITFFNTEHNHDCLLQSRGPNSLDGSSSFRFATFPDGLPPSDTTPDQPRPIQPLVRSLERNPALLFQNILLKLIEPQPSSGFPPVSIIISDTFLSFPLDSAREFIDCHIVLFTASSPSCYLAYSHFDNLLDTGVLPFKDPDYMTNGSLDVKLDLELPSMKGMRLRDLPSQSRTTEKDNPVYGYIKRIIARCKDRPIIFNAIKALDDEVLKDLSEVLIGPIYTVGPLHRLSNNLALHESDEISDIGSSILKEDSDCLQWLDSQIPNSIVYASFGSTTTMTNEQLIEFAWGLANSKHPFLWVIRPDTIIGQSAILPAEFEMEIKGRGILVSWCPQEKVLNHPSVGVYLTHSGWNSTLETISSGVPVICWPYKGDHQPISWWSCYKWGIGMELDIFPKRDQVEKHIKEALEEEKGRKLKLKAMEWKQVADEAISSNGSSTLDIDRFIDYVASLQHVNNASTI